MIKIYLFRNADFVPAGIVGIVNIISYATSLLRYYDETTDKLL